MNREGRLGMIEREHPRLSLVRQCALLNLSRSSLALPSYRGGRFDREGGRFGANPVADLAEIRISIAASNVAKKLK